jgi:hypothetical protein
VAGCEFGAEATCNDGQDNDGDGTADCDDPDCLPDAVCQPDLFTFTDTFADDIATTALSSFFGSITTGPNDYLLFEIVETTGPVAICAQQASFYRSSYLSLAPTAGSVNSGSWTKWFKAPATGGAWVPNNGSYQNRFGTTCLTSFSWCPEWALAGQVFLEVHPAHTTPNCELVDGVAGCSNGNWQFTLKVGPSRLATCGF